MPNEIDFYFDFASPYGYFASTRIDELAARHHRQAVWRPILLGPAFKTTGNAPLVDQPVKGDYVRHDCARFARFLGVPFRFPERFPFGAVAASRAYYWMADRDREQAKRFARAVFRAGLGEGRDVTPVEVVADIAAALGADRTALTAALASPELKQRLMTEVDAAITRGVFGSPIIFIDGERFWGADRLDQVEHWLATGGW